MYDMRSKVLIVAVATVLFLSTAIFALVMLNNEEIWDDLGTVFTYMAVFFTVFLVLNVLLVVLTIKASRNAKNAGTETKRCTSCSSVLPADARSCHICHAAQPIVLNDDAYLRPRESKRGIRPKN